MNKTLVLLLLVWLAAPSSAQELIVLSDDDIALLGLEFAPAMQMEQQAGVTLPGTVINSPEGITQVSSRHGGVLEQWFRRPGDSVAAGDALALLRSPELLQLQQRYLNEINELERANRQLQRDQSLFDQGIIARQRLLDSQSMQQLAEVAMRASETLLAQSGMSADDLQSLRSGSFSLGSVSLRAPVAGVLAHRALVAGDYLAANTNYASLSQPGRPWLSIQLPARLLPLLEAGVDLKIPASDQSLTLRQRDYEIDTATQSLEILAEFDGPATVLPGQLQSVALHPRQQGVYIPAAAVVREAGSTLVYVRVPQGVEARALELLAVGNGYLAQSGVRAGEALLVRGTALVKGIQLGLGSDE